MEEGCWIRNYIRLPGDEFHSIHFDTSEDVQQPLERFFLPTPLAGVVLNAPATHTQSETTDSNTNIIHILSIIAATMAAVLFTEMSVR